MFPSLARPVAPPFKDEDGEPLPLYRMSSYRILVPLNHHKKPQVNLFAPPMLDRLILHSVTEGPLTSLSDIVKQYVATSGTVLDVSLPYEPTPDETRRIHPGSVLEKNVVVTVAHCVKSGKHHKITMSSGFALNSDGGRSGETLIATCAHTLEEIRHEPLLLSSSKTSSESVSGTFILTGPRDAVQIYPASHVAAALPRSDILLLACRLPPGAVRTLPVSPYPPHKDTPILTHFVSDAQPMGPGWVPWTGDTWSKWFRGRVLGYRDFAGKEATPGTYDDLSHMFFNPLPTLGSSGSPIIDEGSGAVVGIVLGSRTEASRIGGVRGWGVPAEIIYEMFALPGLEGKK